VSEASGDDDPAAIVGYVVADTVTSHGRPLGHVKNLAVYPERRGEGIGQALLERALAVLSRTGVVSVKLEVRRPTRRPAASTRSSASSTCGRCRSTTPTARTPVLVADVRDRDSF